MLPPLDKTQTYRTQKCKIEHVRITLEDLPCRSGGLDFGHNNSKEDTTEMFKDVCSAGSCSLQKQARRRHGAVDQLVPFCSQKRDKNDEDVNNR